MVDTKVNWILTDSQVTVNWNGQTHMLARSDAYADKLIQALKERNFDAIPDLVSAAKRIETFSNGMFQVRDGKIFVDDMETPRLLGQKIKSFCDMGLPYEPLVEFARKLQLNPSKRALDHLYEFLEKNNHPITENGNIILYKKVKDDFTDCHTGKFDNTPGQVLSMPRNKVDEDPDSHCSHGFHVANFQYASTFGAGPLLEVEVNPKDVVAIPRDCDGQKIRVCEYRVLSVIDEELSTPLRTTTLPADDNTDNTDDVDYCEACDCDSSECGCCTECLCTSDCFDCHCKCSCH